MTFLIVGVPVAVSMLFILYYYVAVTSRTPLLRPHVTSTTLKPTLPHFTFPPEIQEPLDKIKEIAALLSSVPPNLFQGGFLPAFPDVGGLLPGGIGGILGPGSGGVKHPPKYKTTVKQVSTKAWFYITRNAGLKQETAPPGYELVTQQSALENYGEHYDPDRKERFPPSPVPPGGHFGSLGAPHRPY